MTGIRGVKNPSILVETKVVFDGLWCLKDTQTLGQKLARKRWLYTSVILCHPEANQAQSQAAQGTRGASDRDRPHHDKTWTKLDKQELAFSEAWPKGLPKGRERDGFDKASTAKVLLDAAGSLHQLEVRLLDVGISRDLTQLSIGTSPCGPVHARWRAAQRFLDPAGSKVNAKIWNAVSLHSCLVRFSVC